jgi:hypothetical protein
MGKENVHIIIYKKKTKQKKLRPIATRAPPNRKNNLFHLNFPINYLTNYHVDYYQQISQQLSTDPSTIVNRTANKSQHSIFLA